MLNKLNLADLQVESTKASELKALSNIASRFLTLLAVVDVSIESIMILYWDFWGFCSSVLKPPGFFSCLDVTFKLSSRTWCQLHNLQCCWWLRVMIPHCLAWRPCTALCHQHKDGKLVDISVLLCPAVTCTGWIILGKVLIPETPRKTYFDMIIVYRW